MKWTLLFFFLLLTTPIWACTCMEIQVEMDSSIIKSGSYETYLGTIVSRKRIKRNDRKFYVFRVRINQKYTLQTDRKYIKLITPTQSSACGFPFKIGRKYLITNGIDFTRNGIRRTSICLRNVLKKEATYDIKLIEAILNEDK